MKFSLRQLFTSARHMNEPLDERSVGRDPITLFQRWFAEARKEKIIFPEAMSLATVDAEGHPSARMVLLKSVDERGFVFSQLQEREGARDRRIRMSRSSCIGMFFSGRFGSGGRSRALLLRNPTPILPLARGQAS
jgi:pyridoxine/pyridoxamine 5'-phosphate oxidase